MLAGYHGRYVRVDVATGTSSSESLAPEILRRFLGGVGLGTWILAVETEPGTDPLAEQSTLVFALSEFLRGGAPCLQASPSVAGGAALRNAEINNRILITGPFPVQSGHRPWALLREQR